ncbi:hypothetical protein B0J15DRAFT_190522 [Fusarium solani]|uniref:Uncharacterized protein n=1 Tax=Fusarium solani TaxID=169388 RepID=A0A9P9RBM6_FUSSL|nr:uncharacterized protein B0J15DRAFT_190522 [Fusarium solani]KAH7272874.1 hypothetical protein B0J15DRAFT_190522 [Fusarium solani]
MPCRAVVSAQASASVLLSTPPASDAWHSSIHHSLMHSRPLLIAAAHETLALIYCDTHVRHPHKTIAHRPCPCQRQENHGTSPKLAWPESHKTRCMCIQIRPTPRTPPIVYSLRNAHQPNPYRNALNDLFARGDGTAPTPSMLPRPVSRSRPPRMFGVFAQNAQM